VDSAFKEQVRSQEDEHTDTQWKKKTARCFELIIKEIIELKGSRLRFQLCYTR
jgi:hypothetical protein